MAITRVQSSHAYPGTSKAFGSAVTTGNLIVVMGGYAYSGAAPSPTFSDASGNSYTQITQFASTPNGNTGVGISIAYAVATSSGVAPTLTMGTLGTSTDQGMTVAEYSGLSGLAGMTPVTTTAGAGATATPTSGSFTPTAGSLLIAAFGDETTSLSSIAASGSGWGIIQADTSHNDAQEENLNCSAGAQTASFSLGATSNAWVMMVVEFLVAAASNAPKNVRQGPLRPGMFKPGNAR
jgi:hypothetical protein